MQHFLISIPVFNFHQHCPCVTCESFVHFASTDATIHMSVQPLHPLTCRSAKPSIEVLSQQQSTSNSDWWEQDIFHSSLFLKYPGKLCIHPSHL